MRFGRQGTVMCGMAAHGKARSGVEWQAWYGQTRLVLASQGLARQAWYGKHYERGRHMIYKWKTNFFKTSAEIAAGVMDELSREGRLTAANLVEASRPEDAPLHRDFEWDNDKAAEMYRQDQARLMIRNIVVINDQSEKQETTRAFVHIQQETPVYESIEVVVRDEDKLQILYETAKKELISFKMKYKGIQAFAALFEEIDKLPDVPA